jgi:uncharacterized protein (TIGR02266 family)
LVACFRCRTFSDLTVFLGGTYDSSLSVLASSEAQAVDSLIPSGGRVTPATRQYERVIAPIRCWCEANEVLIFAPVGNISEGGLFLKTSSPLPTGMTAKLRISVPHLPVVETRAVVAWSRTLGSEAPCGMGMRFEDMSPGDRANISRWMHSQTSSKNSLSMR